MQRADSVADLQKRARWYVNVRWFYLLGIGIPSIAAIFAAYGYPGQAQQDTRLLFVLLIINGLFFASTRIHTRRRVVYQALAAAQILFDLVLMGVALYINRGGESPLAMFLAIPILMTAAFFGSLVIYVTGFAAIALYTALTLLDYARVLPVLHIAAPQLHSDPQLVFPPLVAVITILLSITVITDLAGRLIREREQLANEVRTLGALQEQTEAILRTMGSALAAVDRGGNVLLVNKTFEKITGWRRKEVIGRPLDNILPILDIHGRRVPAAYRPMLQFMSDNKSVTDVGLRALDGYSYVRKDGSTFPFVGNVAPILSGGQVIGFTTVFNDATEMYKLEKLKDNFIALVSHQLKTPIGEINGFAYNLLSGIGGTLSPKQTEYVTLIQEQAARSGQLIADLLDIVLAGKGSLTVQNEPIEIGSVIAKVIKQQSGRIARKGLAFRTVLPKGSLYVRADELKLMQVLGNLINNAVAYSKQGSITLTVQAKPNTIEVLVADNGRGMDPVTVEILFGASARDGPLASGPTAEGGTGLGVYLARQLVGLMNGSISVVESSAKHGTTICVSLPRVQPGQHVS